MFIVPLTADHLASFRGMNAIQRAAFPVEWIGKALAVLDGDKVIGVCGASLDDGDFIVGMMMTEELRCKPLFLHRNIIRGIRTASAMGARRIVASADDERGRRWLIRLGFTAEGDRWVKCLA